MRDTLRRIRGSKAFGLWTARVVPDVATSTNRQEGDITFFFLGAREVSLRQVRQVRQVRQHKPSDFFDFFCMKPAMETIGMD